MTWLNCMYDTQLPMNHGERSSIVIVPDNSSSRFHKGVHSLLHSTETNTQLFFCFDDVYFPCHFIPSSSPSCYPSPARPHPRHTQTHTCTHTGFPFAANKETVRYRGVQMLVGLIKNILPYFIKICNCVPERLFRNSVCSLSMSLDVPHIDMYNARTHTNAHTNTYTQID